MPFSSQTEKKDETSPFVSGLIVLPRTNVFPAARESSKEATKSANTSAASASCFCHAKTKMKTKFDKTYSLNLKSLSTHGSLRLNHSLNRRVL